MLLNGCRGTNQKQTGYLGCLLTKPLGRRNLQGSIMALFQSLLLLKVKRRKTLEFTACNTFIRCKPTAEHAPILSTQYP
jgi:hypothetical protein